MMSWEWYTGAGKYYEGCQLHVYPNPYCQGEPFPPPAGIEAGCLDIDEYYGISRD
jgi:hypothetical protein